MSLNVMIDIETLGVTSKATITQIGAVAFDMSGVIHHKLNVHVRASGQGRTIDPDTIMWWMLQKEEVRRGMVIGQNTSVPLREALIMLRDWFPNPDAPTWSHGSDFDLVLLADAYRQVNVTQPWDRRMVRDTRTLFALASKMKLDELAPMQPGDGPAHDALADATRQARAVVRAYSIMALG